MKVANHGQSLRVQSTISIACSPWLRSRQEKPNRAFKVFVLYSPSPCIPVTREEHIEQARTNESNLQQYEDGKVEHIAVLSVLLADA